MWQLWLHLHKLGACRAKQASALICCMPLTPMLKFWLCLVQSQSLLTPPTVLGLGQASPLRAPASPRRSRSPALQTEPQLATPVAPQPLHAEDTVDLPTRHCPSPSRQPSNVAASGPIPGGFSAVPASYCPFSCLLVPDRHRLLCSAGLCPCSPSAWACSRSCLARLCTADPAFCSCFSRLQHGRGWSQYFRGRCC